MKEVAICTSQTAVEPTKNMAIAETGSNNDCLDANTIQFIKVIDMITKTVCREGGDKNTEAKP